MTNSANLAIAQWLADGNELQRTILSRCTFHAHKSGELSVTCNSAALDSVIEALEEICRSRPLQIPAINLHCDGDLVTTITPEVLQGVRRLSVLQPGVPLIWQLPHPSEQICIARQRDHVCLYTTIALDRASKAEKGWESEDLSQWHLPGELERYINALETHSYISGFTYRALNYLKEPQYLTINAWLTFYKGQQVRVSQTLQREAC